MVDAGYGKAAIPILLKAKELYVRFTNIPSLLFFCITKALEGYMLLEN